jgi:uncharacterized protein (TIGR00369 family)
LLKDTGRCFACGKLNPHGLQLDIRPTAEGVELDFTADERFAGWRAIVHGGIVATLLDELMAWACTTKGMQSVTAEMTVRFRKPLAVGQKVRGQGRTRGGHGRLILAESRLLTESGQLVAEASGKMMRA